MIPGWDANKSKERGAESESKACMLCPKIQHQHSSSMHQAEGVLHRTMLMDMHTCELGCEGQIRRDGVQQQAALSVAGQRSVAPIQEASDCHRRHMRICDV